MVYFGSIGLLDRFIASYWYLKYIFFLKIKSDSMITLPYYLASLFLLLVLHVVSCMGPFCVFVKRALGPSVTCILIVLSLEDHRVVCPLQDLTPGVSEEDP